MADQALVTFKAANARAARLLKTRSAITDLRKRSIRSDWATAIRRLMRWPQDSIVDRVDTHDALIVLKPGSSVVRQDFSADETDDLLRGALVLSVSAMDAYFHAKIVRYVAKSCRQATDGAPILKQTIPVRDVKRALSMRRPYSAISAAFDRQLSFQSLQQPNKIADTLRLIGVNKFWDQVADELSISSTALKSQLEGIVRRRNQIAHEGDLIRGKKARNNTRTISPKFVQDGIDLVERVVSSAELVINRQLT